MSYAEETFIEVWKKYGRGRIPHHQYPFSPQRKFLADFAWPKQMLIVEIDGFGYGHGFTRGGGSKALRGHIASLNKDHERQNHAVELGWKVLRYTTTHLGSQEKQKQVCEQILSVLGIKN